MGKISQGPYGGVLGKLGNTIGSVWRGKAYLRIRPLKYNDQKSAKQLDQRSRFAACTAFSKPINNKLIKTSFEKMAEGITGYNLFMQKNVSCFGTDGTITNYEQLKLSVGSLPLPAKIVVQNDGTTAGAIRITWEDNSDDTGAAATDRIGIVYVTGVTPVVMKGLAFARSEELATIQLDEISGQTVHVYVYFVDEESETYSNSFHAMVAIPIVPAG
jgi:hypothetical protein